MSYDSFSSRSDRYEKRRKNTKIINILIILAVLLSAFLIGMIFLDDDEDGQAQDETQNEDTQDGNEDNNEPDEEGEQDSNESDTETDNDNETEDSNTDDDEINNNDDEENTDQENPEGNDSQETDEDVKEVIKKDWEPYPTEQEEPHKIELADDSQDRFEIEMAISEATEIPRDNLTYWWLESGGVPDRIIGYVESRTNDEYYRVFLRWIENEGWQPQRVEVLYENLGKEKLESSRNNND